jgi:dihydropteroate synthase
MVDNRRNGCGNLKSIRHQNRPIIMGILNVTPDSFSDGGLYLDQDKATERGLQMIEEGADIIDVGGQSSRPGSAEVDEEEEKSRVLPVIEKLRSLTDALISIDTKNPAVAKEATSMGARMINDVSMLRHGAKLAEVAAESGADLVLMHSRKTPKDMQVDIVYDNVVSDVVRELKLAVERAEAAGVNPTRIWLDPGIGFAKTLEHNLTLFTRLPELAALGFPIMVGPSRKSFIGQICPSAVTDRLGGSAAGVVAAVLGGALAVRVHDVAVMRQAAMIAYEIKKAGFEPTKRGQ